MDILRKKTSGGFSTLEMLIAMAVLIIILGAITLVSFGNQSVLIDSQTNMEALIKAQEILEKEQALARKDFKLVNPDQATSTEDIYDMRLYATSTDTFTKRITALISWKSDHERKQKVELSSLVTNFDNAVGGDTCDSILSGDWKSPKTKASISLGNTVSDSSGQYPITDIDIHQKKFFASVKGASQTAGPQNPSTGANQTGVGTLSWSSAGNILTSNGSKATRTMSGTSQTNYLKANNFGFAIPYGSTILGISVDIERSRNGGSGTGDVRDNEVKIVRSDGTIGSTNKASSSNWPTSDSYASYGNASDLWGEEWTASDINNSNFGVVLSAKGTITGTNRTASVDHMRITITYVRQFYAFNVNNSTSFSTFAELQNTPSAQSVSTGFNAITVATSTAGQFVYVATNAGPASGQFQVIDMSGGKLVATSTYKIPGVTGTGTQGVGNSIFYKNGYVYLGLTKTSNGPEFSVIDVHTPNAPIKVADAIIGNDVNAIYVGGNLAFVASPNTNDLMVFDVSISKLANGMSPIKTFSGTGGLHGKSVTAVGDSVYLGRTFGTNELYVLSASTTPISDLGHIDLGSGSGTSVNDILVRDFLTFVINTSGQFQIWKTDNPQTISRYDTISTVTIPTVTGNNNSLDCEGNYIYAGSTDSTNKGWITVIAP